MNGSRGDAPKLAPEARAGAPGNWFAQHAIGLITLLTGLAAFVTVAAVQEQFWSQPDLRLTVPFLVATIVGAVMSMSRKEGAIYLPLLGVGLAAAAMVLGFFVVFAAVVAVTALIIVILSGVM